MGKRSGRWGEQGKAVWLGRVSRGKGGMGWVETGSWDQTLRGISSVLTSMLCVQSASGERGDFIGFSPLGTKEKLRLAEGEGSVDSQ